MDFRCSNSAAALALFIGVGGGVLFTPASRAGDAIEFSAGAPQARGGERIEFSAPAIPLAVPQREEEPKEPVPMFTPEDAASEVMGGEVLDPSPRAMIRPRPRGKSPWDDNPPQDDDPFQRDAGDRLVSTPQSSDLTSNSVVNMQRGSDSGADSSLLRQKFGSGLDPSQDAWRPGLQTQHDGDPAQTVDRFGREIPGANEGSLWKKAFIRDASGTERFNSARFLPFMDEYRTFSGGDSEDTTDHPGPAADAARPAQPPPGFTPEDQGQAPRNDAEAGLGLRDFRAWESPTSSRSAPSKSSSNPDQPGSSHVLAPNRPSTLAFPKRPGDPH